MVIYIMLISKVVNSMILLSAVVKPDTRTHNRKWLIRVIRFKSSPTFFWCKSPLVMEDSLCWCFWTICVSIQPVDCVVDTNWGTNPKKCWFFFSIVRSLKDGPAGQPRAVFCRLFNFLYCHKTSWVCQSSRNIELHYCIWFSEGLWMFSPTLWSTASLSLQAFSVTSCPLFLFLSRRPSENLEEAMVHPDGQLPVLLWIHDGEWVTPPVR